MPCEEKRKAEISNKSKSQPESPRTGISQSKYPSISPKPVTPKPITPRPGTSQSSAPVEPMHTEIS